MQELTPAQRRDLKARAHHLQPVVMISEAGLTPQVIREIDANLSAHELIKIRILGDDREARTHLAAGICEQTGAAAVQQIGKILIVYRPKPAEAVAVPKKRRPQRKGPRRTKRSYQA